MNKKDGKRRGKVPESGIIVYQLVRTEGRNKKEYEKAAKERGFKGQATKIYRVEDEYLNASEVKERFFKEESDTYRKLNDKGNNGNLISKFVREKLEKEKEKQDAREERRVRREERKEKEKVPEYKIKKQQTYDGLNDLVERIIVEIRGEGTEDKLIRVIKDIVKKKGFEEDTTYALKISKVLRGLDNGVYTITGARREKSKKEIKGMSEEEKKKYREGAERRKRARELTLKRLIRLIENYNFEEGEEGENEYGSDAQVLDTNVLDLSKFELNVFRKVRGGDKGGHKDIANKDIVTYKAVTCQGKEGYCLINCVRSALRINGNADKRLADKCVKETGVETPIKIDDIEKIEEYYNVGIRVVADEREEERQMENFIKGAKGVDAFRTRYVRKEVVIRKSTREGIMEVNVVYKNNHYSLIKSDLLDGRCEYCGEEKEEHIGGRRYCAKKLNEEGRLKFPEEKKEVKKVEKKEKAKKEIQLLMYDVETTRDEDNNYEVKAYSNAYIIVGMDREIKESASFESGEKCMEAIADKLALTTEVKYIVAAYNGSNFDHILLARELQRRDPAHMYSKFQKLISNNRILKLVYNGHSFFDPCQIIKTSLKKGCADFKTKNKKIDGYDHEAVQKMYNDDKSEGKINFYEWAKNDEKLKEYNIMDVLAAQELTFDARDALVELFPGCDMFKYMTLAQLAYDLWSKEFETTDEYKIVAAKTEEEDVYTRRSLIGGRTQANDNRTWLRENNNVNNNFVKLMDGRMCLVDFVSLYPYVMKAFTYPCNESEKVEGYIEPIYEEGMIVENIGVYDVKFEQSRLTCKIIPRRGDDETLDWKYDGEIETVLNTIDIECLRKYGVKVEVGSGYNWKKTCRPFKDFIKTCEEEKKHQDELKETDIENYNPAKRQMCKLIMNSLSGKFSQRNFKDNWEYVKTEGQYAKFMNEHEEVYIEELENSAVLILHGDKKEGERYKQKSAKSSIIGSCIYSYARRHIYDNILARCEWFYMDTDSALIYERELEMFEREGLIGKEFGQLDVEYRDIDEAILIAPKTYYLHGRNMTINPSKVEGKYRFKGFPKDNKWCFVDKQRGNNKNDEDDILKGKEMVQGLNRDLYVGLMEGRRAIGLMAQFKKKFLDYNENGAARVGSVKIIDIKKELLPTDY